MRGLVKQHKFELLLGLFIIIYIAWFSFFTLHRFNSLHANYYDLGIMDQTVYNTSRGRILELTDPEGSATIKRMAIHNDILLAGLAPLYLLYSGPETLLVTQTIVLGLGAIFVYLIAMELTKRKYVALAYSFMYLMYPALQWANTYDFHMVTFATTLILALYYALMRGKFAWATLCFVLILFAKEQTALVLALLGLLIFFKGNTLFPQLKSLRALKRLGITYFVISGAWFAASIWLIIPYFRQAQHFALNRYGNLSDPVKVLQSIFNDSSLSYFISLFGPLLFLTFLSPLVLILAPELAINVLSSSSNMQSIIFHYTAVLTPVIFISAIYGILYMHTKFNASYKYLLTVQIVLTLLFSYYRSPLPYSKQYDERIFSQVKPELFVINSWAEKLENEDIIVSASLGVATKFTNRKVMIPFSLKYTEADYVVLLKQEVLNDWFDPKESRQAYEQLLNDPSFTRIEQQGSFEVYKKN